MLHDECLLSALLRHLMLGLCFACPPQNAAISTELSKNSLNHSSRASAFRATHAKDQGWSHPSKYLETPICQVLCPRCGRTGRSVMRSPSVSSSSVLPATNLILSRTGFGSTRRPDRSTVIFMFIEWHNVMVNGSSQWHFRAVLTQFPTQCHFRQETHFRSMLNLPL